MVNMNSFRGFFFVQELIFELAVALATHFHIDELSDSDDRHSGIKNDAEIC